ncbi:MAG: precorrin-2 C(20)-methyltransferase [Acidimicrobiales bacterium]
MTGQLWGIGVGPGDPELITVKGRRLLQSADVVAYFQAVGKTSNARTAAAAHLRTDQDELPLTYPVTTEQLPPGTSYEALLVKFYDESAERIGALLDDGADVAVICEGDPFFYGSYMYLHNRLADVYDAEVVPGIPAMLASAAVHGAPLVCRNEMLAVLSGLLPAEEIEARLRAADAAVVMKLGPHLAKVRACVERAGLLDRAVYVERATMAAERVVPLAEADPHASPYFSLVLIPSDTAHAR